jgi:hypothetical protein
MDLNLSIHFVLIFSDAIPPLINWFLCHSDMLVFNLHSYSKILEFVFQGTDECE